MRATFLLLVPILISTSSAMASSAGEMPAAEFLVRAEKLEKKGMLAMLSDDLKQLRREAEAAAEAYREMITTDKQAGRAPHSCPPEGTQSLGSKELLEQLRSYSPAERENVTITVAFADLMKDRYPCS